MPLPSADIAALRAAEQALVESFEASDPTAWVDSYPDDAIFVAPGGAAIEGRAALLAHARQMTHLSSARIVAQTTDGDGDMAATLGSASWVNGPRDSGGATSRVRFRRRAPCSGDIPEQWGMLAPVSSRVRNTSLEAPSSLHR